jgi:DNA-binding CsgD family transcriptional regulator
MMGHKQNLRTMKAAHWKLTSLISREKYAEAREQLKKIVGAAMQLTSDLHALELRSNVDKYYKQSGLLNAPPKPKAATNPKRRPRLPLTARDKEVITDLTKQGRSLREISTRTKRSPSTVWDYQQTLKQTASVDRAERAWLTPEERATFWMQKLGIKPAAPSAATTAKAAAN